MKTLLAMLKQISRTFSPNCRDVTRLQSDAMERELSWAQRSGMRMHLLLCKCCRRYGTQIRLIHAAAQEHPDKVLQARPGLSEAAQQRLKETLRQNKQ